MVRMPVLLTAMAPLLLEETCLLELPNRLAPRGSVFVAMKGRCERQQLRRLHFRIRQLAIKMSVRSTR